MSEINHKVLAREYAFKFLYHLQLKDFSKQKEVLANAKIDDSTWNSYFEDFDQTYTAPDGEHPNNQLSNSVRNFALQLVKGSLEHHGSLVETIKKNLKRDNFERINLVDLTILLISTFELAYLETPRKVVINEAVNLAQKFGGENTSSFINGVLDGISQ